MIPNRESKTAYWEEDFVKRIISIISINHTYWHMPHQWWVIISNPLSSSIFVHLKNHHRYPTCYPRYLDESSCSIPWWFFYYKPTLIMGPMQTSFPSHSSPYPSKAPAACTIVTRVKHFPKKIVFSLTQCVSQWVRLTLIYLDLWMTRVKHSLKKTGVTDFTLVTFSAVAMIVITWREKCLSFIEYV